ncbi:SdrD B-like domain-containing protein [Brevibacterium jeotgali]|uniref:SdrD B-like domain-containing protein n=1 Tax=Brevibacterium jeotgali TaxID=1262550 RepID=UPI0015E0F2BF|nr:SdrD B-like domain-containing protein [Brevibacterium jeotgali]
MADEAALTALEERLQAAYDRAVDAAGSSFAVTLDNVAQLGSDERTGSFRIQKAIAGMEGPNLGNVFSKGSDWDVQAADPADDGTLDPALDITYDLNVDLGEFDGSNPHKTLDQNVVVGDSLRAQASWNRDDGDFVTAEGLTLERLEELPGDAGNLSWQQRATLLSADEYVNMYYLNGQDLYANLGMDPSLDTSLQIKATIDTVEGLNARGTGIPGETAYSFPNRGELLYGEGRQTGYNHPVDIVATEESEDGFNAPDYFAKAAEDSAIEALPGTSADVAYTFTVGSGKGIDLRSSTIVDHVDTNVFDVSDLAAIKAGITAEYDWWRAMDGSHFELGQSKSGDLEITLSDAGWQAIDEWGADKQFELTLTLPTKPLNGKETVQIENRATLFGEDERALYWSEIQSEVSSYGDEAEIRKAVRETPNEEWTNNLRADIGPDGQLVNDQLVYNVALVPHGDYDGVAIIPVSDVLPDGIEFVGFVDDENVDSGANPTTGIRELAGNVQARFVEPTDDAPQGTVVMEQAPGTVLNAAQGRPSVNILVRVTDFVIDEPIVNMAGSASATVTPSDGYPLTIAKVDATDPETVIDDPDARFRILDADGAVAVDDVFVQDGALRVRDADGAVKNVKVAEPGAYTVEEIVAPDGYAETDETIQVVVDDNGSSEAARFYNDPAAEPEPKDYAVGDYVWIDADGDGLQNDAEVLPGVTVTLLDGEGDVVATTQTDADGRYMFDQLDAGDYQIEFELTDEQAEIYEFTQADAGGDDAGDSDADPQTGRTPVFTLDDSNEALTTDYATQDVLATEGIDPTWDAGVVLKPEPEPEKVSVGDYVWFDENNDGRQDDGEVGIGDVVLELTGPEGEPVVDVNGDPVGPVTTDEDGFYTFEDLPVLEDDQSYTVTIDREASADALEPYDPTLPGVGDREGDSSEWSADSQGLTNDGDHDPTLDFGFVLKPEPEPTEEPTVTPEPSESPSQGPTEDPAPAPGDGDDDSGSSDDSDDPHGDDGGDLPRTGFSGTIALVIGLLLVIGGVVLVRRTSMPRR